MAGLTYSLSMMPVDNKPLAVPGTGISVKTSPEPRRSCRTGMAEPPSFGQPAVGLDLIDGLPIANLPEEVSEAAMETMLAAITALASESTRKESIARVLARDIMVSRTMLRYLQAKQNIAHEKYVKGKVSARKYEILERAVKRQHRMMLESITLLSRLDAKTPSVRIAVEQAAVLVRGDE